MELRRNAEFRCAELSNEEILDAIITCKREIVNSVTKQSSNRVQFNTGDRDVVLRATELLSDLLTCLAYRQGST